MADTATLQAWLAEAEAALHQLEMGRAEVSVSYNGKMVTYKGTERAALQAYIAKLKAELGEGGGRPRSRGVVFG